VKKTSIRVVMAGLAVPQEILVERGVAMLKVSMTLAQESWDSTCGITYQGFKSRGGLAVPQGILVERGVVISEVQILLVKETRIRVVMAGRTMTIAKVKERREKKYSKISNGMLLWKFIQVMNLV
jgi:hypothetical protein